MASRESLTPDIENETELESVYVARQPVFDNDMQIWGYELLFRSSMQGGAGVIEDQTAATAQVMLDGFNIAMESTDPHHKMLINYPAAMLRQGAPRALPAGMAVVEILETVQPEPDILEMCVQLKDEGYTLALDDFVGDFGFEPLLELADIVKVDVLGLDLRAIIRVLETLEPYSCILLAEKVEDQGMFDLCRSLGFHLYQGYFFGRPQIMAGRKFSSGELSRLELLRALNAEDLDLPQIIKIIETDITISYRLLRFINSAGMGFRHKVVSIAQAVALMGSRQIAAWLRVLIMTDLKTTARSAELLFLSLQRARFMEILTSHTVAPLASEGMFLLGLFSFLDALLAQPMSEIIARLGLEPRLALGLLNQDAELQSWLNLCRACENGQWSEAEAGFERLSVALPTATVALNQAARMAQKFIRQ